MSIFTPRFHYNGTDTLVYYTTANPFYTMYDYDYSPPQYLWMPNCPAFAYGRWQELSGNTSITYDFPIGNGVDWWWDAPGLGLATGQTPQLGAAAVWGYYDEDPIQGQPGHVAIVEQIEYDANHNPTYVTCSNSAFNHYQPPRYPQDDFPWFYLSKFSTSDYDRDIIDTPSGVFVGTFKGFVYHPLFPQNSNPLLISQVIPVLLAGKKKAEVYYQLGRRNK